MEARKRYQEGFLKTKTVISSWVFSYVIIVSIPIIISTVLLSHSLRYIQADNQKLCQSELANLSAVMDGYLEEMQHIALQFSMNPQVTSLVSAPSFTYNEHYLFYELQKQMQYYTITNENVSHIGILFMDKDIILTDSTNTLVSQSGSRMLDSRLIELLSEGGFQNQYYYLPDQETFTYILSLPYRANSASGSYLFLVLDARIWRAISDNQKENTFIVDFDRQDELSSSFFGQDMDGTVLEGDSALSSVSYTLVFRNSETIDHIRLMQMIMLSCGGASLLVSIFLVYYFTKRNYQPLLRLVKKNVPDFAKGGGNEYYMLEKRIESIQEENSTLEQELLKSRSMVEDIYLTKLLYMTYSQEEFQQISQLPIWQYPKENGELNLAVMALTVDFSCQKPGDKEDKALTEFIIKNILGDLIGSGLLWQMVYVEETYVVVIHGYHSMLVQACQDVVSQMPPLLKMFSVQIQIGVSIGCKPLSQVSLLYKEAQDALEYCHLYNVGYVYHQDRIREQTESAKNARAVIGIQHKFQNAVLIQEYDSAIRLLPELFAVSFPQGQPISLLRLNMYVLINLYRSCLLEVSEKKGYVLPLVDPQITSLLNCVSLDGFQEQLGTCLKELKEQQVELALSRQEQVIEEIKEYIEIHYSENELSAGQVAEHFQMSLPTVSKMFKKYNRMGMLDYIHRVRISHAKTLLQTKKYTVNEVAFMTGYLSASTFIRIFKKYEGVSPGAFLAPR